MPLNPEPLELLVLTVLHESPQYGYAISKRIAAGSHGLIKPSPGVLYPMLARLEKSGHIAASWEEVRGERAEPDAPGRRRKWYSLTAKGRKRLAQRVRAHRAQQAVIDTFISGLDAGAIG